MPKSEYRVTVTADMRRTRLWIKTMGWLAYIIGPGRAMRLAIWGATRLTRYRLDDGPWRPLHLEIEKALEDIE